MTVWRVQVRGSILVHGDERQAIQAREAAKQRLLDCFQDELVEAGTLTVREDLYQRSLWPAERLLPAKGAVPEAEHESRVQTYRSKAQ